MNILIVYTHHEPSSFTAAMKNVALEQLSAQGDTVVISDLYGQGFTPVAQKWDFVTTSGGHFNYMLEQKHAANLEMAFSPDIKAEMDKVLAADIILFITPLWWLGPPAILKGWFDRILAMGFAWDSAKIFENGLMRGKQVMVIAGAGGPHEFFSREGRYKGTINDLLHPLHQGIFAFCGFDVHEPFVVMNVLGTPAENLDKILVELKFRLAHLTDSPHWLIKF
jgi:NAD(P)H dehydrogenase (quinone)